MSRPGKPEVSGPKGSRTSVHATFSARCMLWGKQRCLCQGDQGPVDMQLSCPMHAIDNTAWSVPGQGGSISQPYRRCRIPDNFASHNVCIQTPNSYSPERTKLDFRATWKAVTLSRQNPHGTQAAGALPETWSMP